MNLKSLSTVLLSLFGASAFAHSFHEDQTPQATLIESASEETSTTHATVGDKATRKSATAAEADKTADAAEAVEANKKP